MIFWQVWEGNGDGTKLQRFGVSITLDKRSNDHVHALIRGRVHDHGYDHSKSIGKRNRRQF